MTIKEFRQKAKKGGFDPYGLSSDAEMFLSPESFQAVGKSEEWNMDSKMQAHWKNNMHKMIDALAEGRSLEDFIETL